jgi:hypothetical protein
MELPLGNRTEELHGDRVGVFAVDPTHRHVRTYFTRPGQAGRERASVPHAFPSVALERVEEMADGFGQPLMSGFGERQPASGSDLPVVDSREALGGEGVEDQGGRAKQPLDLHDLLLSENGLEPVEERNSPAAERLVDQVDLQVHVVPAGVR